GTFAVQPSITAQANRITIAWTAQHGARLCVDVAQVTDSRAILLPPTQIHCSDQDGAPVIDEAEVLWSRGELVLVWRELLSDFSSVLRVARLDDTANPKDPPPHALLTRRGSSAWAPGLAATAEGAAATYFGALPPPEVAAGGV